MPELVGRLCVHAPVLVPVRGNLVAAGGDLPHRVRVPPGGQPEHEERRCYAEFLEEHQQRVDLPLERRRASIPAREAEAAVDELMPVLQVEGDDRARAAGGLHFQQNTAALSRLASTILVIGLLGGTAAAFAVTQGLKLERSPVLRPQIDRVFSPVCACPQELARIRFTLRRAEPALVSVIDADGDVVRDLGRVDGPGARTVVWDGRDARDRVVAEGAYRPRLRLPEGRRTIVVPNEIRVDATVPRIALVGYGRRTISPDGDGRGEGVSIRSRVSEPAFAILEVNGRPRVQTRFQKLLGNLQWYGRRGRRPLPAGSYRLQLRARDLAGNLSTTSSSFTIRIRYIELARTSIRVRAGRRLAVGVDTDARAYRWLLAGARGRSSRRTLVLRAPEVGRYRLFVSANGRAASALVVVEPDA